mgnify:CR=1 FL=1
MYASMHVSGKTEAFEWWRGVRKVWLFVMILKRLVRKGKNLKEISAVVKVDTKELDATIEKVNQSY